MSQPQADPVLDLSVLAALRELGGVDEPGLADELLQLFLQDSSRRVANLEDALASGDRAGLARTAHTLRSSSTNVGALRVARICTELETIAREGEVRDAAFRVRELARAIAAVREAHGQLRRAA
jgi:HPt (histidine-containing phosphotransfer) domain-containing protein